MVKNKKEMIASLVKEGRLAKGYTQKELSELSNISIRSIQRIENGELIPRSFTLKTLANVVDIPFTSFSAASTLQEEAGTNGNEEVEKTKVSTTQKILLSIGGAFMLLLLAFAFLAQATKFPETQFELFVFWAGIILLLTGFLFFLWRPKNK